MRSSKRQQEYARALAAARGEWHNTDYSQRLYLPDDRIAIASDVHIPAYDEELMAQFLDHCREFEIQAIVWLGDLMDMPTFSSWGQTDHTNLFLREMAITRRVMEMAAEVVPVQYWSRGNHEVRLFRKLDHQIGMEQLALTAGMEPLLSEGKLIVSDNPTLDAGPIRHGKATWMLTHPATYGSKPLVVPGELASRFQQNVLSAHAHHWGMSTDKTGAFTVVETGGLFKPEYHEYVQYNVTTHRAWVQGYWFLINGRPMGFRKGDF